MARVALKVEHMSIKAPESLFELKRRFTIVGSPVTVEGFEKDPTTGGRRVVPLEELTQWTPHHYFNEKERKWFTMENQGILDPPATWKFSVLYVTIKAESADKAITNLNGTGFDGSVILVSRVPGNTLPELVD